MKKLTLAVLLLLFLPRGALNLYLEAAHKASLKHLAKWTLLAVMVFVLTSQGAVVYVAWLITTILFATYQYLYVFAYPTQRPVLYEETSLVGILLVVVNHVAVAALCGIGWLGIALHTYSGYYLARVVGRLAVSHETRRIFSDVCRDHPEAALEKRVEMANSLLQNRVEEVQAY